MQIGSINLSIEVKMRKNGASRLFFPWYQVTDWMNCRRSLVGRARWYTNHREDRWNMAAMSLVYWYTGWVETPIVVFVFCDWVSASGSSQTDPPCCKFQKLL